MKTSILLLALNGICFGDEPTIRPVRDGEPHRAMAEGRAGLVIGVTGSRAVHAGLEVLKQGGSAADAAITTALTQVVEAGGSYISFAGILCMTHHEASSGKVEYLDAGFNTLIEDKDPLSIPKTSDDGSKGAASGRTALVPGFMAGIQAAHQRFGKLSFPLLFRSAIDLAEHGFPVDPLLADYIQFRKQVLGRLPETKRVFTKDDGQFLVKGDTFRQPALAATLRHVANEGSAYMYTGEWARRFVDSVRRDGGLVTMRDLSSYHAIWEQPLETTYHDAHIFAPGLSSAGGVDTIEALNLLELAKLDRFGPPSRSAESLFWLMEITSNQAFSFYPDLAEKRFPKQNFSSSVRATREHARWVWSRMQAGEWPYAVGPTPAKSRPGHSSGVVAVDRWGNVAALTHSINTVVWGNTGIFVDGVSVPDSAAIQQETIKRAGAGRRLPNAMAPLIVTREGKPVLATSAIGAGVHQLNVQVLVNVLEFGMHAQSALDQPNFLLPDWSITSSVARVGQGSFPQSVLDGVRRLGQAIEVVSDDERRALAGYWVGIEIDPKTGNLTGAGASDFLSHGEGY